jgi:regulator of sirC expression with transglutaminase-like and TPR domain
MLVTDRFARMLAGPAEQLRVEEAALLIAAHAYPSLDVDAQLHRLDALAERCGPTLDTLLRYLFVDLGFAGNRQDYFDPRNSFLNDVLDRRTGIPISLAVLAMAVGHRAGVPMVGIGMPGHFLLRDQVDHEIFVDPFTHGEILDRAGCEHAFRLVHGDEAPFDPSFLDPIGGAAIIARMLANLRATFASNGDRHSLIWVTRLRTCVPGVPTEERAELAALLAADGQFASASNELEALADSLGGALGDEYRRSADRLLARLN